jgi:hypothetical protein
MGQGSQLGVGGPFVLLGARWLEARVLDMRDGTVKNVPRDGFTQWGTLDSVSPDGSRVALSVRVADQGPKRPEGMEIGEWLREAWRRPLPDPTEALALVDLAAASCTLASGTLTNFASYPAWTANGSACVFGIPFEHGTTIGWVSLDTMRLDRHLLPRRYGTPLADMTDRLS